MHKITFVALADPVTLSPQQLVDLQEGVDAVNAFWSAVETDPFWNDAVQSPLYCCIAAALSVHDILHNCGRTDARVVRSGLDVRLLSGELPYSLTIGDPSAPVLDGMWNAHMTVRLGDVVLDPSYGQTKRSWNHSPHAAVFVVDKVRNATFEFEERWDAKVILEQRHWHSLSHYQTTYFELPRSSDLRTRKWRDAPDARPERREALVRSATSFYNAQAKAA